MADSEQSSKMKEEFEASAKQHFPGWSVVQPNYFQRLPNGDYADEDVEVEWWFWQSAHDAGWLARGKQGELAISWAANPDMRDLVKEVVAVGQPYLMPDCDDIGAKDGGWKAKMPKLAQWLSICARAKRMYDAVKLPAAPTETGKSSKGE